MDIVISLKDLGIIALILALIVLVIYMISVTKNLVVTIKRTNKILEETETVTNMMAERAKQADGAIGDFSEVISDISSLLKGNQSTLKAATNVVNALCGLKDLFSSKNCDKE